MTFQDFYDFATFATNELRKDLSFQKLKIKVFIEFREFLRKNSE